MLTRTSRRWPQSTISTWRSLWAVGSAPARCVVAPAPLRSRAVTSIGRWVADKPHPLWPSLQLDVLQPLEAQGEVRPSLVPGERMDLVDDDRAHAGEGLPAALRREVQVEALRSGDEERRRVLDHGRARASCRVPGADGDGNQGPPAGRAVCRDSAISASGRSRFCWTSTAKAFSGET